MDATELRRDILGLIFLRYISEQQKKRV